MENTNSDLCKKIENSWKMALFILCIDISALFLVMWMAGFLMEDIIVILI